MHLVFFVKNFILHANSYKDPSDYKVHWQGLSQYLTVWPFTFHPLPSFTQAQTFLITQTADGWQQTTCLWHLDNTLYLCWNILNDFDVIHLFSLLIVGYVMDWALCFVCCILLFKGPHQLPKLPDHVFLPFVYKKVSKYWKS